MKAVCCATSNVRLDARLHASRYRRFQRHQKMHRLRKPMREENLITRVRSPLVTRTDHTKAAKVNHVTDATLRMADRRTKERSSRTISRAADAIHRSKIVPRINRGKANRSKIIPGKIIPAKIILVRIILVRIIRARPDLTKITP